MSSYALVRAYLRAGLDATEGSVPSVVGKTGTRTTPPRGYRSDSLSGETSGYELGRPRRCRSIVTLSPRAKSDRLEWERLVADSSRPLSASSSLCISGSLPELAAAICLRDSASPSHGLAA